MKRLSTRIFVLTTLAMFSGCSPWPVRMFVQSIQRMGDPVAPPPRMITTPYLDSADVVVGWIGHASTLVQIRDKVFLLDPLFENTVGMVVHRYVGPGIDPKILHKVDFTIISHTHFDHYSYASLDVLPKGGSLILPYGALQYAPEFGFGAVHELKWWESVEHDGVRITAVPVQHFSGRYGFDGAWMRDHGYSGYVFEYQGYTVFFGGDTGYDAELFKQIGGKFDVDLAVLPIGPGSSTDIGSRIHVHPRGALEIMKDVGARQMVPIHHRTLFYGSDRDPGESILRLREVAAEMGLSDCVVELDIGEQRILLPGVRLPHATD